MSQSVGRILRQSRAARGMSQLDLALTTGVSSRHISFIETGRANPSRSMVLRLAESLAITLRDRNAPLIATGFAPLYGESDLGSVDLAPIRKALELVLQSHEPFPAFVLDRAWNILLANRAHSLLLPLLLPERVSLPDPVNVVRLVFDPQLIRPRVANWDLVAHVLGHRVARQLRAPQMTPEFEQHCEQLLSYPGVREAMADVRAQESTAIVIPLELSFGEVQLSWFSMFATIGTPQDVTIEELCIESMFPADEQTERLARRLVESSRD
jgi:transcriptional regulator with XRE-family HTH domain